MCLHSFICVVGSTHMPYIPALLVEVIMTKNHERVGCLHDTQSNGHLFICKKDEMAVLVCSGIVLVGMTVYSVHYLLHCLL